MSNAKLCPKCGHPMEEGRTYTQTQSRPVWLPKERSFLTIYKQYENASSLKNPVFLTKYSLGTQIHPAWYCTTCNLFMMDCQTVLDEDLHDHPKP